MQRLLIMLAILSVPDLALAGCPPLDTKQRQTVLAPLLDRLATSTSEHQGQAIAGKIWRIWLVAPDAEAQALLDKGLSAIGRGALQEAQTALDDLVAYCPDFPEGWNQRAFARFLQEDYAGALDDLDRTLVLDPMHFAARAGQALTYLRQGQKPEGFNALREAVRLHPWMNERHLLPPDEKT